MSVVAFAEMRLDRAQELLVGAFDDGSAGATQIGGGDRSLSCGRTCN